MTDHDEFSAHEFGRRLDEAIGAGPVPPSSAERIGHGRRALRRRRGQQAIAAVAAAAVVGTGATWAVDLRDNGSIDVAGTPAGDSVDPCPVLPPMSQDDAAALPDDEPTLRFREYAVNEPFAYDDVEDSFSYRPGVRGVEHLTGELTREGSPPTRWDAVEFEAAQGTYYGLATFTPNTGEGGGGDGYSTYDVVTPGRTSLAQWVAFQLQVRSGSAQDVLGIDDAGELVARDGVEILQQDVADLEVYGDGDTVRVAEIQSGPYTCFVVGTVYAVNRTADLGATFYTIAPEYVDGDSLPALARTASEVREEAG